MLTLFPADLALLDPIVRLYRAVVAAMQAAGIDHWDADYPNPAVLRADIDRGELFTARVEGLFPAVSVAVCSEVDLKYAVGDWHCAAAEAAVVHRLCVDPRLQRCGVGRQVMEAVEAMLRSRGLLAVRLDTFSGNPAAQRFYLGLGYRPAGEIQGHKGTYFLYEKSLLRAEPADGSRAGADGENG